MQKTDILVVGTGIAGLFFAIKTAKKRPDLKITVMTKDKAVASNTQYAQGGIAAVMNRLDESFEKHISDTLKSGGGQCDEGIVRMVVRQAPERLEELISVGVDFDKTGDSFDLALEGGHSENRILHRQDVTGSAIEQALLNEIRRLENVDLREKHFVIDLDIDRSEHRNDCVGAFYFDENDFVRHIRSKATVLSTGGCGQLFLHTTNPEIATGDGVAMSIRAHAEIKDLAYVQYHPTAFFKPADTHCFLISEALRGFGAHIVDHHGKRFVFKYDIRGELATRDVVSNAIATEMRLSGKDHMYLDCRHLDADALREKFPNIVKHLEDSGLNLLSDLIPIVPVAHYQCGGILVNSDGQTTINRLYAIGECACTGLHGKNRLASNSLLEAVVFGHQASEHICGHIDDFSYSPTMYINMQNRAAKSENESQLDSIREEIRRGMEAVFTENGDPSELLHQLTDYQKKLERMSIGTSVSKPLVELVNMLTVAGEILRDKINKKTIVNTEHHDHRN